MYRKKKILSTIGFMCILVGLVLIGVRLLYSSESKGIKDTGQAIIDDFEDTLEDDSSKEGSEENIIDKLREAFSNDDVVAYLYYPSASISYPVVQGSSNEVYLRTNIYGKYSINGSIFLDYMNASDFSDSASIIYGHHMRDGSMFGNLERNCSKGDSFYIYTRTSKLEYKIVSTEVVSPDSRDLLISIGSSDLSSFRENLKSISNNYIISENDTNLVTLVTCHYTGKDTIRFGATGSLVSTQEYKGE